MSAPPSSRWKYLPSPLSQDLFNALDAKLANFLSEMPLKVCAPTCTTWANHILAPRSKLRDLWGEKTGLTFYFTFTIVFTSRQVLFKFGSSFFKGIWPRPASKPQSIFFKKKWMRAECAKDYIVSLKPSDISSYR